MNENLNLAEILKDYPKGTKLYSLIYGDVKLESIQTSGLYPISYRTKSNEIYLVTSNGKSNASYNGECTLFPSREQRDWSKFTDPWLEKQGKDKKEINNFDVLPGLYKCVHRMFDGTPDGKLLFEIDNVYKCLSKHDRAEFEVSYGHSVYLEDPVVCKYFIPFEGKDEKKYADKIERTKQPESEELCESQEITKWAYISDPLHKQPKFDPKTLQPFDKVLVFVHGYWSGDFYSSYSKYSPFPYLCFLSCSKKIIPYNEETKHLLGTNEEVPEFYRYWED